MSDVVLVEDSCAPPLDEAVEEKEKTDEQPSILGEQEEIRMPDKGDLRDFLREFE